MGQPNPAYEPPVDDPRDEGVKHWDLLRSELMVTRDALRSAQADAEAKSRRIDDLSNDLNREKDASERARNECIALRTSLENVGRMLMGILKDGRSAANPDPFKPKAIPAPKEGDPLTAQDIAEVEQLIGQRKVPEYLVSPPATAAEPGHQ